MKLNYKRTILVGFAFFLIMTFWQAYDTIIPKILTDKFGMSQAYSGIVMALDNVLALFMLPLFGALSDKSKSKMGRRTPYILIGTLVACVAFMGLTFSDNMQLTAISDVSTVNSVSSLETLYDNDYNTTLQTPDGEKYVLKDIFTREEFTAITTESTKTTSGKEINLYTNYVVPARQAFAWQKTVSDPTPLIIFMITLLIVLIAMAVFRSPAVALMPDVTIKPLRSKANAIINLMGTAGPMCVLALGIVFATGSAENAMMSYTTFFAAVVGLMLLALLIFMLTVREPKFVADMKAESEKYGIKEDEEEEKSGKAGKLTAGQRASLLFILASVVFWYMGYNAVTSKYSVYAPNVLNQSYNTTLLLANAAAIISYIPVGILSSKLGRKKTILAGVIMLAVAFGVASTLRAGSPSIIMNAIFCLAGIGWATINVNSFPMAVELASAGNVGKYTGFYYTASMAAQTITPYLSGKLMDLRGMTTLFPYATVTVCVAFVTMLFVRHGDNKPTARKGLEAVDIDD
ncbi:MAG: MFS transporter [Clostridia bacterium]|nr:MFS transporter [Clostridia bacterium]